MVMLLRISLLKIKMPLRAPSLHLKQKRKKTMDLAHSGLSTKKLKMMPKNQPNKQKVIQKSKNTRKWHQTLLMVLPTLKTDRLNSLMEPMFQELTKENSLRYLKNPVMTQMRSQRKKLRNIL
jgi:hypothetical protein